MSLIEQYVHSAVDRTFHRIHPCPCFLTYAEKYLRGSDSTPS